MDKILITTTVSLDADVGEPQKTIHLVVGDYGTRRFRMIPVSGGRLMDMTQVAAAKVRLACAGREALLIDCVLGSHYADMIPTEAMVDEADEWQAQLVLLDDSDQTLSTAPFTICVHGTVYEGDAVEHTDNSVMSVYYDEQGRLTLEKLNGDIIRTAGPWEHTHEDVTEEASGFMPAADHQAIETLQGYLDQEVKTDSDVEFKSITVGGITINEDGTIEGARFT